MLKDKPWYKSLTIVGAALLAASQALEATGVLPPGISSGVTHVFQSLGEFLAIVGIRRAVQ